MVTNTSKAKPPTISGANQNLFYPVNRFIIINFKSSSIRCTRLVSVYANAAQHNVFGK